MRHSLARIGNDHLGDVGGVGKVDLALAHNNLRTVIDGILSKRMTVAFQADDAEKRIAGLHLVGAVRNARYFIVGIPKNRAIDTAEQLGDRFRHVDAPR